MEQYISKAAIAAWIEKIKKNKESEQGWHFDEFDEGYLSALDDIENFLNAMETKEVDLEEDVDKILEEYDWNYDKIDFYKFAEHFYELGQLNARKKE